MKDRQLQNPQIKPKSPVVTDQKLRDPSLPEPTLDQTTQDVIGAELRSMYANLASQPVPQRLLDLIEQLGPTKGGDHGE